MARFHKVGDVLLDVDAIVAVNFKDSLQNGTPCCTVHLSGGSQVRFLDMRSEKAMADLVGKLEAFKEPSEAGGNPRLGRT